MTFLVALRHDGMTAPFVLDGPIHGECFKTCIEQIFVPTLKPGDIVIMANVGLHKSITIRNAIRAVGAKLVFLPPYFPSLHPIEQVFAKLISQLRKAKERAVEAVWRRIGKLLYCFTPPECSNDRSHSGSCSI